MKSFASRSTQVTVGPGRMYIDPGNFVQIKRPLMIDVVWRSMRPDQVQLEIAERADAQSDSKPTHYYVVWSRALTAPFPASDIALKDWLVCALPGVAASQNMTLGELRAMRTKE